MSEVMSVAVCGALHGSCVQSSSESLLEGVCRAVSVVFVDQIDIDG